MSEVCSHCGIVHDDENDLEASWHYWAEYTKENTLHSLSLGAMLDGPATRRFAKIFSVTATTRFEMDVDMRKVVVERLKKTNIDGPLVKITFLLEDLEIVSMCVAGNMIEDDDWAKDLSERGAKDFLDFVLVNNPYRDRIFSLRVLN